VRPRTPSKPAGPQGSAVGDGLYAAEGRWTFSGGVAQVFDAHVSRSLPGYAQLHEICVRLASDAEPASAECIYDLGCSTGTLTRLLRAACPSARVIGVDAEREMVVKALEHDPLGLYVQSALEQLSFERCDLIFCLYVLQFQDKAARRASLTRMYQALRNGGRLVVAEKVIQPDPDAEAAMREHYYSFKQAMGYSLDEIEAKEMSLRGILRAQSEAENLAELSELGFRLKGRIFQELCFSAWLLERP
jgi:tRNA (cmo5U34)-methyltransferase